MATISELKSLKKITETKVVGEEIITTKYSFVEETKTKDEIRKVIARNNKLIESHEAIIARIEAKNLEMESLIK